MHLYKYRICKTPFSLARGLMFSTRKTLLFDLGQEKKVNLHMLFVFFKIHVYFLNEKKRVIEIKEDFKPFMFYASENKARYFVESPKKLDIKIRELIEW